MEWTQENITDEMWENIDLAMLGEKYSENCYIPIDEQRQDQVGLQYLISGTYHDKNDVELFDFMFESGINNGTVLLKITPPDGGINFPEPTTTIYRYWVKKETLLSLMKLKDKWEFFREEARKMTYDKAFSPTNIIDEHYQSYADKIGAKIISFTGTGEECFEWERLLKDKLHDKIKEKQPNDQ